MRNFPVVTVDLYEGTLTRYTDAVTPTGGIAEGAAVYSAPLVKGDLVQLKTHTETGGIILVEDVAANDNIVHGMVVSDPFGIDNTTVSEQTPAAAYRRKGDVAFFGLGIIELTASATGAVAPGDIVGLDADEQYEVEAEVVYGSAATQDNAKWVALSYAAAGSKVALLIGSCFDVVN